jgi:hypothetical protein
MHDTERFQIHAPRIAKRRPRFTRAAPPPFRLTTDDLRLLAHVQRHRFLRSTHIAQFLPHRSHQKLINRLSALYHAGYLDRPRTQLDYFARSGSAPMIYALGNKGAAALSRVFDLLPEATTWAENNRTAQRPYIEHALLIADFMVPIETALGLRGDIALLDAAGMDALRPAPPAGLRHPWKLSADGLSAIPDAVFGLYFKQTGRRSYFFVEADRATMTIVRFKGKIAAYLAAHRAKRHVEQLGLPNLRILTVTTSAERVASMLDAVHELTDGKGSGIFLFTDRQTLRTLGDPLTLPWSSTSGMVRIDRPPR